MRTRLAVLLFVVAGTMVAGATAASSSYSRRFASGASSSGARFEILYTSNWEGPTQIFAVDPARKVSVGQVTFAPPPTCDSQDCVDDPLPSPDGRRLAFYARPPDVYSSSSALWLSLADGSASRLIATSGVYAAAWSPDSSRLAYLADCCLVNSIPSRSALHVVSAGGASDRIVGSASSYPFSLKIVWSADSRHVRAAPIEYGVSRSPDGRWEVVGSALQHADGSLARVFRFGSTIFDSAWSPDSRYFAYVNNDNGADKGIHVLDMHSRTTRLLTTDVGCYLAWSPDGPLLAYLQGTHYVAYLQQTNCASVGDLRTVTPDGHVRVVAAADGPYAPLSSFLWTRVPKGVHYRAPSPITGLNTGSPITALAADGGQVAYATCVGVFTWNPAAAQPVEVASTIISDNCVDISHEDISHIALAGDRLAYVDAYGGNTTFWSVHTVSLGTMPYASSVLASGTNTSGPPVPEVAGSGGVLTLATRDIRVTSDLLWHIQTVGPSGCPCQEITSFEQPRPDRYAHLDDVDAGRIVVNGGGLVRVLGGDGEPLLTLPLQPSEAALSGDDLVVHVEGELRDYSASTGTLLHTWPLATAEQEFPSVLQDVAHGLAADIVHGELHLLRLSDGSDTIVGPASFARFTDTGLVEAAGSRIHLVPYDQLPLR